MNDHAFYLTIAYGVTAVLLAGELLLLRVQGKRIARSETDAKADQPDSKV